MRFYLKGLLLIALTAGIQFWILSRIEHSTQISFAIRAFCAGDTPAEQLAAINRENRRLFPADRELLSALEHAPASFDDARAG